MSTQFKLTVLLILASTIFVEASDIEVVIETRLIKTANATLNSTTTTAAPRLVKRSHHLVKRNSTDIEITIETRLLNSTANSTTEAPVKEPRLKKRFAHVFKRNANNSAVLPQAAPFSMEHIRRFPNIINNNTFVKPQLMPFTPEPSDFDQAILNNTETVPRLMTFSPKPNTEAPEPAVLEDEEELEVEDKLNKFRLNWPSNLLNNTHGLN